MFKVKATLIGFAGDTEKYPCHFNYQIGDEIIFDGENFIGRICIQILPLLDKYVPPLFAAGPRYVNPNSYYPYFYAPLSTRDPSQKKYDGVGNKIYKGKYDLPKYHMGTFSAPGAFTWPPHDKRDLARDLVGRCDDLRTAATFKFEAFDLAEKGDATPYFRKEMLILSKVLPKPGIEVGRIRGEFSRQHLEEIYPGLFPVLLEVLAEELQITGYLSIEEGRASVTPKGEARLKEFITGLSPEEKKALEL
jgi:hypothetical protein